MPLWLAYLIIVCAALWTDCDTSALLGRCRKNISLRQSARLSHLGFAHAPGVGALRAKPKLTPKLLKARPMPMRGIRRKGNFWS
jgi:hypothetical protein